MLAVCESYASSLSLLQVVCESFASFLGVFSQLFESLLPVVWVSFASCLGVFRQLFGSLFASCLWVLCQLFGSFIALEPLLIHSWPSAYAKQFIDLQKPVSQKEVEELHRGLAKICWSPQGWQDALVQLANIYSVLQKHTKSSTVNTGKIKSLSPFKQSALPALVSMVLQYFLGSQPAPAGPGAAAPPHCPVAQFWFFSVPTRSGFNSQISKCSYT